MPGRLNAGIEVGRQYTRAARSANSLRNFIREQGWPAESFPGPRADALLMIPAAIAAGLGELGKHGSIINRTHGASFRLAAVSTDMPLLADEPDVFGADDFCHNCRLCTDACPPDAIAEQKQLVRGDEKWYVDFDRCIPYFAETKGCAICIARCPWSRPGVADNLLVKMAQRRERRAAAGSPAARERVPGRVSGARLPLCCLCRSETGDRPLSHKHASGRKRVDRSKLRSPSTGSTGGLSRFRDLNTELEERYMTLEDKANVDGVAPELTAALLEEGQERIAAVAALPELDLDAERGYDLLGNVGLFMAALRRHELTNPAREQRSPFPVVSGLAQRLATGLGVVPRFATAHTNLSNPARDGVYKSFTWLEDELLFIDYNCFSILAYIRAADVLRRVPPLGVTHPVATALFRDAAAALADVRRYNDELDAKLNVERFFFNVRPYFKPYRVGRQEYRGANAGDFAGINEVDLTLGLCRVSDPEYAGLVLEKMPFMTVDDQRLLQACVRSPPQPDGRLSST